jgi:hypothetical protein
MGVSYTVGSTFNPASPGAIGGTTPAAITGTTIDGDIFTSDTNFVSVGLGIAAAPAFAFPDGSGIYQAGAGLVDVSCTGVRAWTFDGYTLHQRVGGAGNFGAIEFLNGGIQVGSTGSGFVLYKSGGASLELRAAYAAVTSPFGFRSYTVATLPDATVVAGQTIYVSDASGTPCLAFSNGTVWKRCDDAATTVT